VILQNLEKAIVPILFVAGASAAAAIFATFYNLPDAAAPQRELKSEFRSLDLPEDATVRSLDDNPEWGHVLISGTYETRLGYEALKSFYSAELERNGWRLASETGLSDWGRDLGGRQLTFCKKPYEANLQYAGHRAAYGWDYAFSMSWNRDKGCG
jgi:hypothetical protein